MTREELLKTHELVCHQARELMKKKNADYAGKGGTEPFANFTRVESLGICKTEVGMMVRMVDKISRLSSFLETGKFSVEDEGLVDTIIDIINYSVLVYAYLKSKTPTKENVTSPQVLLEDTYIPLTTENNNDYDVLAKQIDQPGEIEDIASDEILRAMIVTRAKELQLRKTFT